jgi:acetyl-CoA C-acetyltransferase
LVGYYLGVAPLRGDFVERVAIIGVGQSVHARERRDVAHAELLLEAIDEALDDAGVGLDDIDNAVTASLDFYDGRTIANMSVAEVVGSYLKPESRICSDGIGALMYGWARIADGEYGLALVTAHCKESEGNPAYIEGAALDPFTERRLGADADVVAALAARRVYAEGGVSASDAAALVVAARDASRSNPKVETLPSATVADVLDAPRLASPLGALDKAPSSDGACALVIARGDLADELSSSPTWITGLGTGTARYWSDRDPLDLSALRQAHDRAVTMAGWGGDEPDIFEVSAQYSYELAQFASALGADLSGAGERLNPSGGRHAGNPVTVTGLSRVAEAAYQLRGTAGDRQQAGVSRVLAHGAAGLGAQSHFVAALEGGE